MRSSEALKDVLGVVLAIGNYMNGGAGVSCIFSRASLRLLNYLSSAWSYNSALRLTHV